MRVQLSVYTDHVGVGIVKVKRSTPFVAVWRGDTEMDRSTREVVEIAGDEVVRMESSVCTNDKLVHERRHVNLFTIVRRDRGAIDREARDQPRASHVHDVTRIMHHLAASAYEAADFLVFRTHDRQTPRVPVRDDSVDIARPVGRRKIDPFGIDVDWSRLRSGGVLDDERVDNFPPRDFDLVLDPEHPFDEVDDLELCEQIIGENQRANVPKRLHDVLFLTG